LRPNVPYKCNSKASLFSVKPAQKSRGVLQARSYEISQRHVRTRHVLLRLTNTASFTFSLIRSVTCTCHFISASLKILMVY